MRPIIGVPLRYSHLEDGRAILYIGERIRRTLQNAGGEVFSPPALFYYTGKRPPAVLRPPEPAQSREK